MFDRGYNHILDQIYLHLPLNAIGVFKNVSPQWEKIISKLQNSKIPRLRQWEEQKLESAWKNGKPAIVTTTKLLDCGFAPKLDCEILADELDIFVYQYKPHGKMFVLNPKNLKIVRTISFADRDVLGFQINKRYLVGFVQDIGNDRITFFIWTRSEMFAGEPFVLPWARNISLKCHLTSENFLNRFISKLPNADLMEKWNLSTNSLEFSEIYQTEDSSDAIETSSVQQFLKKYVINDAFPMADGSDDVIFEAFQPFLDYEKSFFSRHSKTGSRLWRIETDSSFHNFDSEFLALKCASDRRKVKIVNLTNGKVEKSLDLSNQFSEIVSFQIQGRRIAIEGVTSGLENDIFVFDWRTGQTLAKSRQLFNWNSNEQTFIRIYFCLRREFFLLCREGLFYSANFLE